MHRIAKILPGIGLGLALSACQSAAPPASTFKSLGNNAYSVTSSSSTANGANALALQNAQRLCQTQGRQSQTQSGQSQFVNGVHQFTLDFTCN